MYLLIDSSAHDAYLSFTPSGTLADGISVQMDVIIPSSTLTTFIDNTEQWMADWFQAGQFGGVYGRVVSGSAYLFNDYTPNDQNGLLPTDTSFTIKYDVVYDGISAWDVTVKLNGTIVDSFSSNFFGVGATDAFEGFKIGAIFADHIEGETYKISNVSIKNASGTTLFSTDFSGIVLPSTISPFTGSNHPESLSITSTGGGGGGGGGPTYELPTNDSCAHARELTGVSGSVYVNNTDWAGIWPTGSDPLWNYFSGNRGGGVPLWWKWTNTTGQPVSFQIKKAALTGGIQINVGMVVGGCGSIDFDIEFTDTYNGNIDYNISSTGQTLDVRVEPDQTVYIEIDSYGSNTGEPPTADHRGKFNFNWSANTIEFYDSIVNSQLLATNVFPTFGYDGDAIRILDGISLGSRYYACWTVNTEDGNKLYAGVMNADGTGISNQLIADNTPTGGDWRTVEDDGFAYLCTDGIRVWLAYSYQETIENPDDHCRTSYIMCPGHALTQQEVTHVKDKTNQVVIKIWEVQTDHSWSLWKTMQSSPAHPDWGPAWGDYAEGSDSPQNNFFRFNICSAANDPNKVWVAASYANYVTTFDEYHNNFPKCSLAGDTPQDGIYECLTTDITHWEHFDVWYVTDSAITQVRAESQSEVYSYLSNYNPNINPIFGAPWTYSDGTYATSATDMSIKFSSITAKTMWMYNDGLSSPVIAMSKRDQYWFGGETFENEVAFVDAVTGTTLHSYTYSDFGSGVYTSTAPIQNRKYAIWVSPIYHDPLTNHDQRFISTYWGSAFHRIFLNKLETDSTSPSEIYSGYPNSTQTFSLTPRPDGIRNYWVAGDGIEFVVSGEISQYDMRCNFAWQTAYFATQSPPGDHLAPDYQREFGYQKGYWNAGEPPYYVMLTEANELRRYTVKRDYYICSIGSTPVVPITDDGIGLLTIGRISFRAYAVD